MRNHNLISKKSLINQEILAYLLDHPEAQDTLDGIVEWWLLEQNIRHHASLVKDAVDELVGSGFLVEHKRQNSKTSYRVNKNKLNEVRNILERDVYSMYSISKKEVKSQP